MQLFLGYKLRLYGSGAIDIPRGYENTLKFNGTLAHKINHDFDNNVKPCNVSFIKI